jgi:riboflavin biosynthesis pyrimidine reductase
VGAQSVRAEGYVVPRAARLAVVTASGDLEGHRLVPGEDAVPDRVLVLCSEHVAERLSEREPVHGLQLVPVPGPDRLTPRAIIDTLVSRGLRRIVCEGGPSLATQLADAGLIDEFCITITPVISPVDRPFVSPLARLDTEVMGALSDEAGFSYLRLRVRR